MGLDPDSPRGKALTSTLMADADRREHQRLIFSSVAPDPAAVAPVPASSGDPGAQQATAAGTAGDVAERRSPEAGSQTKLCFGEFVGLDKEDFDSQKGDMFEYLNGEGLTGGTTAELQLRLARRELPTRGVPRPSEASGADLVEAPGTAGSPMVEAEQQRSPSGRTEYNLTPVRTGNGRRLRASQEPSLPEQVGTPRRVAKIKRYT